MRLKRLLKHLLMPPWRVGRAFPAAALATIETAIKAGEQTHTGQVCFAVEAALDTGLVARDYSARERAIDVFGQLRVWDTEQNNGVLIYLLLADHDVEIIADRGIHARVGTGEWEHLCQTMEQAFRAGQFEDGVVEGIRGISAHLQKHYPGQGKGPNELADRPVIL